jgi:hypothetical protein
MRADGEKTLRIVDYCLQKRPHSIEELSLVAEVSEKTIRKNIKIIRFGGVDKFGRNYWPKEIEDNYEEIVHVTRGPSNKEYFEYINHSITLFPDTLSHPIVKDLIPFVEFINTVDGLDNFSNVAEVITDLIEDQGLSYLLNNEEKKIIRLDSKSIFNLEYREPLRDFLPECRSAVISMTCLKIKYQPFNSKPSFLIVSPYKIVEYNNRWFLIAKINEASDKVKYEKRLNKVNNLAFDRILSVEQNVDSTFLEFNGSIDDILDCSCGPSIGDWQNIDYNELVLKVPNYFANYIRTKPIIKNSPIETVADEFTFFTFKKIIMTIELKQFIRSYAEQIEVISPVWLRNEVIEDLKKTLCNYTDG